jgi:hypothetical protein
MTRISSAFASPMRIASARVSAQTSCGSLSACAVGRFGSRNVGRPAAVLAASGCLFQSFAATHATAPSPNVRKDNGKTTAAVVRNLLKSMVLSTPSTSGRTDAETSPAVIQSEIARTAARLAARGNLAEAASNGSAVPSPTIGTNRSRISRSRNRARPRKRQLLTVPIGRPILLAASSQV